MQVTDSGVRLTGDGGCRRAVIFPGAGLRRPGADPERGVDGGRGIGAMDQWMMPVRSATATMPARSPVPSLRAMRARWLLTVSADRPIETPIALFD